MVYASIWQDDRLYRRKTIHLHADCISMHQHFVHCEIFDVKHWNITQRCKNYSYCFICVCV